MEQSIAVKPRVASRHGAEERPRAFVATWLSGGVRPVGTGQPCPPTALPCLVGLAGARSGSVANLSAFHPTRLETRTKESNMRASHWAVRNPKAQ